MFFNSQPNFLYPDFKVKDNFKVSKNFFRRVRSRDNFNSIFSSSIPYSIIPGETVEQVSYKEFGDTKWYWTILLLNNILDIIDDISKEIQQYFSIVQKSRHLCG